MQNQNQNDVLDADDDNIPEGDPKLGKAFYGIHCASCHNLNDNRSTGPELGTVINRKAASIKGFRFSKALKNANLVWTKQNLFLFLQDPETFFPDTNMAFQGISDPWIRACIVEYLQEYKQKK